MTTITQRIENNVDVFGNITLSGTVDGRDVAADAATNAAHIANTNAHVDHSTVSITAGTGLSGGGTIAATRTISISIPSLTEDTTPNGAADYLMTYDASATTHKKVLLNNLSLPNQTNEFGEMYFNYTTNTDASSDTITLSSTQYKGFDDLVAGNMNTIAFIGNTAISGGDAAIDASVTSSTGNASSFRIPNVGYYLVTYSLSYVFQNGVNIFVTKFFVNDVPIKDSRIFLDPIDGNPYITSCSSIIQTTVPNSILNLRCYGTNGKTFTFTDCVITIVRIK